jgi:hypothetical protein
MRAVVVAAVVLALVAAASASRSTPSANCERTSTGLVPLTDLGTRAYQGFGGGIYGGGKNQPLPRYRKRALEYARRVRPIDGKVVLLSIGMSNTTQEFRVFKEQADADSRKSASVVIVDGAQGGQDAERIEAADAEFWRVVDARLARAGASPRQVQVVWLKEAIARPTKPFPAHARGLQADLRAIVAIARQRYPNLRLVYVSSRTYGGYASTALNPEPYAYESGFAVKWLVQDRFAGRIKGPWVAWGPYLWTDGTRGRRDGVVWTCSDTRQDGTHPSPSGAEKVSAMLLRFFTTEPSAKRWFVR